MAFFANGTFRRKDAFDWSVVAVDLGLPHLSWALRVHFESLLVAGDAAIHEL